MKRKHPMPSYYSKNIAQNAQKRFFRRKAQEAEQEKRKSGPEDAAVSGKKD